MLYLQHSARQLVPNFIGTYIHADMFPQFERQHYYKNTTGRPNFLHSALTLTVSLRIVCRRHCVRTVECNWMKAYSSERKDTSFVRRTRWARWLSGVVRVRVELSSLVLCDTTRTTLSISACGRHQCRCLCRPVISNQIGFMCHKRYKTNRHSAMQPWQGIWS